MFFEAQLALSKTPTYEPTNSNAFLLIDGRPSSAMISYTFVKVNLSDLVTEGTVVTVYQDKKIKYGNGKWSEGRFFSSEEFPEGYYFLTRSVLGNGWISLDSCYNKRSALFYFKSGQINLLSRKDLIEFLPDGAVTKARYIEKILSENPEADAAEAIAKAGTINGDIETINPIGYYSLEQQAGEQKAQLFKGCSSNGMLKKIN